MKFNQLINKTRAAGIHHKKRVDEHGAKVMKAIYWLKRNGHDHVDCGLIVKYKGKKCMITHYHLGFPFCYFSLQPMSSSVKIGVSEGGTATKEF